MVHAPGLNPSTLVTAVLTGPTAAGKTGLALEMARERARAHPGQLEIINADSMLVYRGMSVGTAKPTPAELDEVPHHLIDIRDPDQPFTAGDFIRATETALTDIHSRGKRALIVGGTGFYLRALFFGLWEAPQADLELRGRLEKLTSAELHSRLEKADSASANRISITDRYRLVRALELIELGGKTPSELQAEIPSQANPRFELWIVDRAQEELSERISLRCRQMLKEGLLDEVKRVRSTYPQARALGAIGYKEVCAFLDGVAPAGRKIAPGEAGLTQEIELATRQLVKRQRTWFKNLHTKLGPASYWFTLPSEEWRPHFNRLYP